jgi:hypothetical protein
MIILWAILLLDYIALNGVMIDKCWIEGIFPLININRLGFVAETYCVSCEARTESLYII